MDTESNEILTVLSHTACKDEFRQKIDLTAGWSVFVFFCNIPVIPYICMPSWEIDDT